MFIDRPKGDYGLYLNMLDFKEYRTDRDRSELRIVFDERHLTKLKNLIESALSVRDITESANYMECLLEFHRHFGHYEFFGYKPNNEVIELRYKLIDEEVNKELLPALSKMKDERGLTKSTFIEICDAIADSLYVIFGTCVSLGIPIDEIFKEIHRSNMTKSMEKDTKSIKGKTLKGDNYDPPNIEQFLNGWNFDK